MGRNIHISSSQELAGVLQGPDREAARAVLAAIVHEPELAVTRLGRLEATLWKCLGSELEDLAVQALAAVADAEWTERLLALERQDWAPFQAAAAARQPMEWRWRHLEAWLGGPADPRTRLAANLLLDAALPPAQAVRVAVRSDVESGPSYESAPRAWEVELAGPYRERALLLLGRTAVRADPVPEEPAFADDEAICAGLTSSSWVVRAAACRAAGARGELLRDRLRELAGAGHLAALAALAELGDAEGLAQATAAQTSK